jgi:predicted dehydrogenase
MKRRVFLKNSAAALAASTFNYIPGYAVGKTGANDMLNLAIIGCSNRGGNIGKGAIRSGMAHCVALCDVVPSRADELKFLCPDARVFNDFRRMFDRMANEIDACIIGTPDHSHFPIAMLAMSLGKHVYVEKPLAHTFEECELLMEAEKKYKVMCQMGNQGHSANQRLQFKSWLDAGIIKNVRRVDASMNKGRRWHPWGDVKSFPPGQEMPEGMNWDVWAATAPKHPYHEKYDPGNWRGWYDYGNGAFGDWGPHTLDSIHRYLKLGLPREIRAEKLEGQNEYIYPKGSTIAFDFPERGPGLPAMSIYWYDGTHNFPPRPEELPEDMEVPKTGKIMYGDELTFMGGTHADPLQIIPPGKMEEMKGQLPEMPESETSTNHMHNFLRAASGKDPYCNSSFGVAAPLTQVFMLGCIAQRLGGTLKFDARKKKITNNSKANRLLKGNAPRKGWKEFYRL